MIGSLISAGVGAAGSIFGGIAATKAINNMKNNIKSQMADNENWYNRRYNEDATQRADAQAAYTKLREDIRSRNKASRGTQAVMGGTEESVAATKEANAQALADTTSQIAVAGANRKDSIESAYQQNKANLNSQLNDLEQQKAQAISSAIQGVTSAASSVGSMF